MAPRGQLRAVLKKWPLRVVIAIQTDVSVNRIGIKELVCYVTLFISNLISSKKRLNKISLLFKEFKKSCTSNFRG